jgi:hypothetical protein
MKNLMIFFFTFLFIKNAGAKNNAELNWCGYHSKSKTAQLPKQQISECVNQNNKITVTDKVVDNIILVCAKQFQDLITLKAKGDTLSQEMKKVLLATKKGDVVYIEAFVGSKKYSLAFKIE